MTKILVIEDEFDIRDEVMSWLQFEGYEVIGAENGKTGMHAIHQHHPDIVLCDISMPEMDGHEVLIELRSDTDFAQLPFVFLTAAADREAMRQAMTLGADDYITKPFKHSEVINAVQTRLHKQAQVQDQLSHLASIIDEERQQRQLKSRLVGMFSHDFRNPLASILSASGILQNYADRLPIEKQQKYLRRIDGSVHLLLQMLDDMLMIAEVENGQLIEQRQAIDLEQLIERTIHDFVLIDEGKHHLTFESSLPLSIAIDRRFVQHIITNLLSNAIKYSPEGSTVTVQASAAHGQVIITVQDAGIGIPEADIARVFDPFFRASNVTKADGTGLGLALVKQLVDVCGGRLEVTSELGQGSCFSVMLPHHQS